nr:uncharacterized protein LOC127299883 isoform X4 [Lolium perenne]
MSSKDVHPLTTVSVWLLHTSFFSSSSTVERQPFNSGISDVHLELEYSPSCVVSRCTCIRETLESSPAGCSSGRSLARRLLLLERLLHRASYFTSRFSLYNYTYGDIDDSIESITHLPMLQVAADADAGVHDDDHQCLCPWPRCRCRSLARRLLLLERLLHGQPLPALSD